jgi:hypothetical protein
MLSSEEKNDKNLIAPCGIDCGVCKAHLRANNPCQGCRCAEQNKPKTRVNCKIRLCEKRKGDFCDCNEFQCERLAHLDKRYREKYGMSEIENLKNIHENGIDEFIKNERKKWLSEKGVLCIHDKKYY